MTPHIIAQGAEAKIILSNDFIIKDRIKKSYRIPELDEKIRKLRTRSETKLLTKASNIINAPIPETEYSQQEHKIKMPFIDGKKLSEHLDNFPLLKQKQICKQIGKDVAKLHDANIIHGDLTTSNIILVENQKNLPANLCSQINKTPVNKKSQQSVVTKTDAKPSIASNSEPIIFFIDFGLGFISHKYEDKAVDLHLLKQALEAKHFKHWEELLKEIIKGYNKSKDAKIVLERLKAVEKRGRYKG